MSTSSNGLRPRALKASGAVGMIASLMYLAGVLGQDDTTYLAQAAFWLLVMAGAAVAAWYADRSVVHGRRMAVGAAVAFFVVGVFSGEVLSVMFLLALVLAVAGFAGTSAGEDMAADDR